MKIVLLLLLLCSQALTYGQLDTSFDGDGVVLPPYALPVSDRYSTSANAQIKVLPDGKILTFGRSDVIDKQLVLRRYLSDGSVDFTFGDNGVSELGFNINYSDTRWCKSVFLSNGKILLINYTEIYYAHTASIELIQFNANGSIDATFGTNGSKVISDVPYLEWSVNDLQLLPDGRIYIIGANRYLIGSNYYFIPIVIAVSASHERDASFGNNGVFMPENLGMLNFPMEPQIVRLGEEGDLLINTGGSNRKNLIRMTPAGQIDMDFGTSGIKTTEKCIYKLIPVSDNKFWGCGPINVFVPSPQWYITRYNSDLTIDASFGIDGSAVGSFGAAVVQPDGKVATIQNVGSPGFNVSYKSFVKRYNADGSTDAYYQIMFGANTSKEVFDIALQPDGKMLVCGGYQYPESAVPYRTAPWLIRLLPELLSPLSIEKYATWQPTAYPNPFQDRLTLSYELVSTEKISIDLIDLQGRLIRQICRDELQSGFINRGISLADVSPGTYLLKITSAKGLQKNIKIIKD